MRKIIASIFVTLDGLMVGPNEEMDWVLDNFDIAGMGLILAT